MSLSKQQKTIQEFLAKENIKLGTRKIQDLVAKLNGFRSRTHMPLKADKLQERIDNLKEFLDKNHDYLNKKDILSILNGEKYYYYLIINKEYVWFDCELLLKNTNEIVQFARDKHIITDEDANYVSYATQCEKPIFEAKREVPRVIAYAHTDDRVKQIEFDCTDYFLDCDADDLETLASLFITYGDSSANYETDGIAQFFDGKDPHVSDLFMYLSAIQESSHETIGFTCGIESGFEELMDYLKVPYDK